MMSDISSAYTEAIAFIEGKHPGDPAAMKLVDDLRAALAEAPVIYADGKAFAAAVMKAWDDYKASGFSFSDLLAVIAAAQPLIAEFEKAAAMAKASGK